MRRKKLPLPRARELTLVAAVAGGLGLVAVLGARRGYNYVQRDPKFCLSCHTMNQAYDLWAKSGHKEIDCHTCHAPSVMANLHQLWVYAMRRPDEVVKHAEVDRSICEKCHAGGSAKSKWNRIAETPGHRMHVGKQRIECTQCHAMSVHTFKPPKETCTTCHKQITLAAAGTMGEMHCLQCHSFTLDDSKRSLRPDRAACLECHEMRHVAGEVFPAKAPMSWDCGRCHKPHKQLKPSNDDCRKCHDTIVEGVHAVKGHARCLDCHKPHGWKTEANTCNACHARITLASHHPTEGKTSCTACHGAWKD